MDINELSREKLAQMAQANDPNGIWLDHKAIAEGLEPVTKDELVNTFQRWADEEEVSILELIAELY